MEIYKAEGKRRSIKLRIHSGILYLPYPAGCAMNTPARVVLLTGPEDDQHLGAAFMKFRLTYAGPLKASQRDALPHQRNPVAPHKHAIRRVFHRQLKILWSSNAFLNNCRIDPPMLSMYGPNKVRPSYLGDPNIHPKEIPLVQYIAGQYNRLGYQFVPLVCEEWKLLCSLEILFLRRDIPGSVIHAGDIDNRIKTLIDALRMPQNQKEIPDDQTVPDSDEQPFFCLLEDDKQVAHLAVETDTLLSDAKDASEAHLTITVELRPYFINNFNLGFA